MNYNPQNGGDTGAVHTKQMITFLFDNYQNLFPDVS